MHDTKYKDFRFGQIVKHNVRKSFNRPVTNAIVNRCTTFRICSQLIYRSANTYHKVRPEVWLPAIVPFRGAEHIGIKEWVIA